MIANGWSLYYRTFKASLDELEALVSTARSG
jgi:hypothetical protein